MTWDSQTEALGVIEKADLVLGRGGVNGAKHLIGAEAGVRPSRVACQLGSSVPSTQHKPDERVAPEG